MKKITAVLLCVLCIFSSIAMSASAADGIFERITSIIGLESDETIGYGITYDSNTTASGVSGVMYEPKPTVTIRSKGTYTVTEDIPLAIDYEFVYWVDKDTGKTYRAGDKFYVNGQKTLYAVWVEKNDGRNRVVRVVLTAFETFKRSIQSFLGVFKVEVVIDPTADLEDNNRFDAYDYFETTETEVAWWTYDRDTRTFNVKVELAEGVSYYESFSRTEPIFLGGTRNTVSKKDQDGKIYFDVELIDAEKYSALYESKGADDVETIDGVKYQNIRVTITDGAKEPLSGAYATLVIVPGMLRYKDAEGSLKANTECYPYGLIKYAE